MSSGWVGFDLDSTLVKYDGWKGPSHIGEPIPPMIERVKQYLLLGADVRIFTARVYVPRSTGEWLHDRVEGFDEAQKHRIAEAVQAKQAIDKFCIEQFGCKLPVTCQKDFGMIRLYDDRAIQVETNTGRIIGDTEDPS